jgi:phage shock protein C
VTEPQTARRIYRSRDDRIIGGVAGGVADYLAVDPVLVRLAFVALMFAGIGILLYLVAWVIVPEEPRRGDQGDEETPLPIAASATAPERRAKGAAGARMLFGTALIAVGAIMLVDWIFPDLDRILWPAALIAIGAGLLTFGVRR